MVKSCEFYNKKQLNRINFKMTEVITSQPTFNNTNALHDDPPRYEDVISTQPHRNENIQNINTDEQIEATNMENDIKTDNVNPEQENEEERRRNRRQADDCCCIYVGGDDCFLSNCCISIGNCTESCCESCGDCIHESCESNDSGQNDDSCCVGCCNDDSGQNDDTGCVGCCDGDSGGNDCSCDCNCFD